MSRSPSSIEITQISGFWRRLGAFLLDMALLGLFGLVLGLFLAEWFVELGPWGRAIGFLIAAVYFGVLNSKLGGGQTVGKRLLGVKVVNQQGGLLSVPKSLGRFAVLGIPFFLNNAQFSSYVLTSFWLYVLSIAIFGIGLSIVYLYIFNRATRQSLHDLVVGSFVVKADSQERVPAIRPWRFHYAVCIFLMVASGVVPVFTGELAKSEPFATLVELQRTLSDKPWAAYVTAHQGRAFMSTIKTGSTETRYLEVTLFVEDGDIGNEGRAIDVAAEVLELYPTADSMDIIRITFIHGYDIGIASSWRRRHHSFPPEEWRTRSGCEPTVASEECVRRGVL